MQGLAPLDALLRRDRALVLGGLIGIIAIAWAYTAYLAWDMRGMDMGAGMGADRSMSMPMTADWTAADFGMMFLMWAVMMAAMMLPSAAPMILMFSTVGRKRRDEKRPYVPTAVFVAGYVLIWTGFALTGALAQWGLHAAALLSPTTVSATPFVGGALLLAAGIFQWTPIKYACLTECRSPLGFLMAEWREGHGGALSMGLRHGVYCLGCCWVLMALLFVLGVMNLVWIAALAAFVLVEKVAPAGSWISRTTGGLLLGWGLWMMLDSAF